MGGTIIDILSWAFIILGTFSLITGAVGVLRLPDVYTRMHAASITDTLGAGSIILGLMLQAGPTLVAAKLLLILVFIFFTSPASSFALAHAALSSGVEPILDADLREKDKEGSS
ncbi:MAG: monovalent cation/H(+) antiporter subunit G [Alphaproteobacteria bacterium]|jgi:multicomponent Na+:H+ antiporter subunit G